jgi:hypothetical protein
LGVTIDHKIFYLSWWQVFLKRNWGKTQLSFPFGQIRCKELHRNTFTGSNEKNYQIFTVFFSGNTKSLYNNVQRMAEKRLNVDTFKVPFGGKFIVL